MKLILIFNKTFQQKPNSLSELQYTLSKILTIYNVHNNTSPALSTYTSDNLFLTNLSSLCHKLDNDVLNPLYVRLSFLIPLEHCA